jgi:excisionase family DNA binding protein
MTEKLLLKPAEAADAISTSKTTMYELIASKQIRSVRVGKDLRVPLTVLQEWIARKLRQGDEPKDAA